MGLFDSGNDKGIDGEKLDEILERLERVELKLDRLLISKGGFMAPIEDGSEMDKLREDALALLRAGKKIQAVKLWRDVTRIGLKEAKEAVESL